MININTNVLAVLDEYAGRRGVTRAELIEELILEKIRMDGVFSDSQKNLIYDQGQSRFRTEYLESDRRQKLCLIGRDEINTPRHVKHIFDAVETTRSTRPNIREFIVMVDGEYLRIRIPRIPEEKLFCRVKGTAFKSVDIEGQWRIYDELLIGAMHEGGEDE